MKEENIYVMLGLSDAASPDEVKKAFREFAKKNHPDLFPGNQVKEEKFKDLTAAYHNWKLIENAISEIRRMKILNQGNLHKFKGYAAYCSKWIKKSNVNYRA